jgi:ATP-dependent helicase/nuclease subunit B
LAKLSGGMPIHLHLLSWDQPLLKRAVAWLAREWRGAEPLDLSELLVVVPTRQSGRRLREALAAHAAEHGQMVFSPSRVVPPEGLVACCTAVQDAASPLASLLAWVEVLSGLDLARYREVFPVDPPGRGFSWALRLAGELTRLQAALAEAGLRLVDVPDRAGKDFEESARWHQLAELERLQAERLAALGKRDLQAARLAAVSAARPPLGVRRVVVLGTPDPMSLAIHVLAKLAGTVPVDIAVCGPPGGEALFDEWGRPHIKAWSERGLALPDFEERVHLYADPLAQAERVADCARRYGPPAGWFALGVADRDLLPFLENGLARAGLVCFNPEGRPLRREGFFALLEALAGLAREASFAAVSGLIRFPDVLVYLAARTRRSGGSFSPARLLAGMDELQRRHLPATLAAARAQAQDLAGTFPELVPALEALEGLHVMLTTGGFPANAKAALAAIFADRTGTGEKAGGAHLREAVEAWISVARQAEQAAVCGQALATCDWWELVLGLLVNEPCTEDKPAGALELLGWLELLWEDAPHLVVTGFNDGRVPDAVVGDPFLPETLRERLGLKTNAARLARDAYLLQALIAARAPAGRLDLLFGKVSAAGDPLRPSRLLLRCPDTELPRRIAFLFRSPQVARASLSWQRAWRLRPPAGTRSGGGGVVSPPEQVNVTAFRDYLRCPFRFYLRHVLRMEAVDPEKTELDPLDFVNLCHAALEAMGREPALRDCTDARTLREFLHEELERAVQARYGAELSLPLVVQLESARQRLSRVAEVQARERANGWVLAEVEWRFPQAPPLVLGGLVVHGKIDRLDRHEQTGAWRLLDYKTSDKPASPREAHCRLARRAIAPGFARFAVNGRDREWLDLQLPLYLWATASRFPEAVGGYFNLPKAVGETGIVLWSDYDRAWHDAALRTADAVARAIRAGCFWPPTENMENDDFAELFYRGAAESVVTDWAGGAEAPA